MGGGLPLLGATMLTLSSLSWSGLLKAGSRNLVRGKTLANAFGKFPCKYLAPGRPACLAYRGLKGTVVIELKSNMCWTARSTSHSSGGLGKSSLDEIGMDPPQKGLRDAP